MEARRLRYLVEVIEQGSISKAAASLRVSQPALTKAIHLLEAELNVTLLDRRATGVTPTVYGKSLYAHAKAIAAELDHARAEIRTLRDEEHGHILVGALPSAAGGVIAPAVARLSRTHPDLFVRVAEMQNFELLPALRRGEFDFVVALAATLQDEPGLKQRALFEDRLRIIARAGHPLAKRGKTAKRDLARYPWIFPIVGSLQRPQIERLFTAAEIDAPRPMIEGGSPEFVKRVVAESDHLGMLPSHAVDREVRAGTIVCLPIDSPALRRRVAMVYREHHPLPSGGWALVRSVEEVARQLGLSAGKR